MFKRASVVTGIVLAGIFSAGEVAAQSAPKAEDAKAMVDGAKEKMAEGSGAKEKMEGSGAKAMGAGTVFLHETFDSFEVDSVPTVDQLQRDKLVKVVDGGGKVGSGKVAGVGPWEEGRSLTLNSKSKRAFGFEIYQQKNLRLRVGDESIAKVEYDSAAPFNVKIWANDHDGNTFSYKRPDNGETAALKPDSVVVWLNNALMDGLEATGTPMNKDITEGNAVIGRAGLSSASTKVANFLFDNLQFSGSVGQSEESTPAAPAATDSSSTEATPSSLPGAETVSYREGENAMNLFVYKPEGWKADDKRSAFVFFSAEAGLEGLR